MHRHSCPNRINRVCSGTVSHVALCKMSTWPTLHDMPSGTGWMKRKKEVKQIHRSFSQHYKSRFVDSRRTRAVAVMRKAKRE